MPRVKTAQEVATEYLRTEILAGRLPPGTRLAQSEIAATLQLSITPVREALRDLAGEGLVNVDRFRGASVYAPTLTELEETFAVRRALIPLSVTEGVHRITTQELRQCDRLLLRMSKTDNDAQWSSFNSDLHGILDAASGNNRLTSILASLSATAELYIHLTLLDETERRADAEAEHVALVEAYRNRDSDAGISLYLRHFEGTLEIARRRFAEQAQIGVGPQAAAAL